MKDHLKNKQQTVMLPLIPHCNQAQQKNPGIATTNILTLFTLHKNDHKEKIKHQPLCAFKWPSTVWTICTVKRLFYGQCENIFHRKR